MVTPNLLDARTAMGEKKNFIAKATKNSHGQFKAKAEAAGKSTREFAEENKNSKGLLGKQARLALSLMGASKGNEKRGHSPGEARKKLYGSK